MKLGSLFHDDICIKFDWNVKVRGFGCVWLAAGADLVEWKKYNRDLTPWNSLNYENS